MWALCENMVDYAERQVFPGGCFFAATSAEFNNRPGPVRDRIEAMLASWLSYLEHAVEQAQDAGELPCEPLGRGAEGAARFRSRPRHRPAHR